MNKNGGGFTLFETMIVLAVSSVMLITAIVAFGGQQRKTQFTQSLRDLESQISDVMNDVQTGFYPTSLRNCSRTATGPQFTAGTPSEQGVNLECIFVGKAVHFQQDSFTAYSLVGNRLDASSRPVASFTASFPRIIDASAEETEYKWGLRLTQFYTGTSTASPAETNRALVVIASTTNDTGFVGSSNQLNSGVQRVTPLLSGSTAANSVTVADATEAALTSAIRGITTWPATNRLTICFEDAPSGAGRLIGGLIITGGNEDMDVRIQNDQDNPRCT